MTSGQPYRRQIEVLITSATALPVAFLRKCSSIHFAERSRVTRSQVWPAVNRANGPISSVETISQGLSTLVARIFPGVACCRDLYF